MIGFVICLRLLHVGIFRLTAFRELEEEFEIGKRAHGEGDS
jgi:hypothetical protein